jgi:hypothetical protein
MNSVDLTSFYHRIGTCFESSFSLTDKVLIPTSFMGNYSHIISRYLMKTDMLLR